MVGPQAVPYLNEAPAAAISLDLLPVSRLMASPVVTFRETMSVPHLRRVLRDTTHNGFPVVRDAPHGPVRTSAPPPPPSARLTPALPPPCADMPCKRCAAEKKVYPPLRMGP